MICPTAHLPGPVPLLKFADECGRKWSALCLSAYRAIHRILMPERLGWRDWSVSIESPIETDGGWGHLDKPLSYCFENMQGIFLPVTAWGINYCLPKRNTMHNLREINGFHAAGMERWLLTYVSDISWILLGMCPPQTLELKMYQRDKCLLVCLTMLHFLIDFRDHL